MRIALNAQLLSFADSYRSGGISRVIYHTLAELGRDPRGQAYDVFVPEAPATNGWGALTFHESGQATASPTRRILWEQTTFARQLRQLRPDLVHGMAYAVPVGWSGPSVVTVYDLSFLLFPRAFKPANRIYLAATTRATARRARRVLTISEHARRDIVRLLNVPEECVDVTYPAVEDRYRRLPEDEVQAFRRARGLPEAFVFTLGTLEPRKNLIGLLRAYARLEQPRPPLYVAGGTGWRFSPIFDTVRDLHLGEDVHFLGFVAEDELPLWYNAAQLFAFPSLYEGFGLPVLEAMACGAPVVTSTAASLPEVGGKAAVLVPPQDTDGIAQEMARVLDDPHLRMELRAAGRIQASRFSWRAMTDQTVASYRHAVGRNAKPT
ncbi:MAG: glycosyltransferase family 4 protein [Chloroflexi bacterium]|nr:glycosyltransferase family 4 protein [Chloroflexota bacterium]